ncbi:class F sortase [Kribbella antibiotica]|uniref:class F sortase n=1 Tax=Kribbella antibiotica TaxID=190195 RepID=UPI001404D1A4|nr:class F sortase [Kribbella antibiotica]
MTNSPRRAVVLASAALSFGLVVVSAGCTAAGTDTGTGAGGDRAAAPTSQANVSPTPRPAGAAPVSPSITARPAELPSVAAQSPTPARLVVPAVGLDLPIAATGVAEDGQMALPPDPRTIGWYRYGSGPGDRVGSVVLGGHVDSREFGAGPLVRLRKVRRGDVVEVRSTAGPVVRYRVVEVRDIPKKKLAVGYLFDRAGPRRLQVVTCGGPYDAGNGGYRDNLVVTADPMP